MATAIKDNEPRRRSISVFSNARGSVTSSTDPLKRRSFSVNRKFFSLTGGYTTTNTENSRDNALDSIENKKMRSNTTRGKQNKRFFSSPQFSSSTPNLIGNETTTKYIDSELNLAHKSVVVGDTELTIPTVVYKCCDFLKYTAPVEGLFRMNGSIKQINQIEMDLYRNIESYVFTINDENTNGLHSSPNTNVSTAHDIAVVLKRWISKLDDGIITADVYHELAHLSKASYTHFDDELSEVEHKGDGDMSDNESLIDMDRLLESPIKNTEGIQSEHPSSFTSSSKISTFTSLYSLPLSKLPIENLHLTLYLLDFLNFMSQPSISSITKMNDSNLAKVFQLNFFKSVDLIVGTKSFSTEDLKSSYHTNEELLKALIKDSGTIIKDLATFIKENDYQIQHILKSHSASHASKRTPNTTYVLSQQLNNSQSSFTSKGTPLYSQGNHSFDHISSYPRQRDLSTYLETCVERSIPSTPLANDRPRSDVFGEYPEGVPDFLNDPTSQKTHALPAPEEEKNKEIVVMKRQNPKRRSIFGIFNKRKSSLGMELEQNSGYQQHQQPLQHHENSNHDHHHRPASSRKKSHDILKAHPNSTSNSLAVLAEPVNHHTRNVDVGTAKQTLGAQSSRNHNPIKENANTKTEETRRQHKFDSSTTNENPKIARNPATRKHTDDTNNVSGAHTTSTPSHKRFSLFKFMKSQ